VRKATLRELLAAAASDPAKLAEALTQVRAALAP